jgi:type I restriction enzyme S subunit
MKNEWQTKRLGEVCEIIKGRKPALKAAASDGDLPYLAARVMRGSEEAAFASVKDRNSITVTESETIIICDGSNSGEVFTGFRGILSSTMGKISKKAEIDDNYLRAFLTSTFDVFNGAKTGAAIPHLDKEALYRLEFPLPPLREQQRIVGLLEEAFAGIATAKANSERNLKNARALFESHLQSIFAQHGSEWVEKKLSDVAREFGRGKSRHRPRGDPQLLGGKFPFIQTGDIANAKHHISSYSQTYNETGLAQSKLWPRGTVCIAIVGANVAETAILDFDSCFPDSVIGFIADEKLTYPEYVQFLLLAFKATLKEKGKGTARDNINISTFENQRFPFPKLSVQKNIVATLTTLSVETEHLAGLYERKLAALEALKKSLLHQAFTGRLIKGSTHSVVSQFPVQVPNVSTTDMHAGILAIAYQAHRETSKLANFAHVKAEKIAHMVESFVGIDLGRAPVKDAAGPNDFPHLTRVEHRAKMAGYFDFQRTDGGAYRVTTLRRFDKLLEGTRQKLGTRLKDVDALIDLMAPMTTQQAEIAATVFAAWNNLLLEELIPTDGEIVTEARENWHPSKLNIPREKFVSAIQWLRDKNMVPKGQGRKVVPKSRK